MERDERTSSIGSAGVMAMACRHGRPDATRETPAVIAVRINWQLVRDGPGRGGDDQDHPEGCHSLECAGHGGEPEGQPRYRAADLEEAQTAAPSSGVLQVQ